MTAFVSFAHKFRRGAVDFSNGRADAGAHPAVPLRPAIWLETTGTEREDKIDTWTTFNYRIYRCDNNMKLSRFGLSNEPEAGGGGENVKWWAFTACKRKGICVQSCEWRSRRMRYVPVESKGTVSGRITFLVSWSTVTVPISIAVAEVYCTALRIKKKTQIRCNRMMLMRCLPRVMPVAFAYTHIWDFLQNLNAANRCWKLAMVRLKENLLGVTWHVFWSAFIDKIRTKSICVLCNFIVHI